MTAPFDAERRIGAWIVAEAPTTAPDRILEVVMGRVDVTRQRRPLRLRVTRSWRAMSATRRFIAVGIAILALGARPGPGRGDRPAAHARLVAGAPDRHAGPRRARDAQPVHLRGDRRRRPAADRRQGPVGAGRRQPQRGPARRQRRRSRRDPDLLQHRWRAGGQRRRPARPHVGGDDRRLPRRVRRAVAARRPPGRADRGERSGHLGPGDGGDAPVVARQRDPVVGGRSTWWWPRTAAGSSPPETTPAGPVLGVVTLDGTFQPGAVPALDDGIGARRTRSDGARLWCAPDGDVVCPAGGGTIYAVGDGPAEPVWTNTDLARRIDDMAWAKDGRGLWVLTEAVADLTRTSRFCRSHRTATCVR